MRRNIVSMVLCFLFTFCLILCGCGNPNEIKVDGIYYRKSTYISDGVSMEGYSAVGCDDSLEVLNIPGTIKGLPVLGLERGAFQDKTNIKEVTLPDTLTSFPSIGAPFSGCTSIEKMTLANDDVENLFKEYGSSNVNNTNPLPESLTCIYLSSACTKINSRSFRYCRYLKEIHIPSSVVEIDDGTGKISVGVNGHTPSNDDFEDLPFFGCENLTIYCEDSFKQDGWDTYWNYINATTHAKTIWNSEGKNEYKFLAALDSSTISNYDSWSSIQAESNGAVTIVLTGGFPSPSFIWNLSNYNFSTCYEYKIVFEGLSISAIDVPRNFTLRLKWQDSSYQFLRYYHTGTQTFNTYPDNDYLRLQLDSLSYENYSISFKFNHSAVTASQTKRLYFDFDGVEPNGSLSFDKLSIFYRNK